MEEFITDDIAAIEDNEKENAEDEGGRLSYALKSWVRKCSAYAGVTLLIDLKAVPVLSGYLLVPATLVVNITHQHRKEFTMQLKHRALGTPIKNNHVYGKV